MPIILTAIKASMDEQWQPYLPQVIAKFKLAFHPLMSEFIHVDFDDIDAIKKYNKNKDIVAVMVEPIQGRSWGNNSTK